MASIQIFIKTLRGKTITLDANPRQDTILTIQNKIFEIEGIQPEQQMLTYCGKKLESNHRLKFYKISQYCTLDLSLKLLSSPTIITVKLPGENHKDRCMNFTSFTTLQNVKETILKPITLPFLPSLKSFVHHNTLLRNNNIRITEIDSLWNDLTLHTTFGTPFEESTSIEYIIKHNETKIHQIKETLLHTDFGTPIDKLMYKALRQTNINPLYYSGYCPFKQVTICYNNMKQQLRLDDVSQFAEPFNANKYSFFQKCRSEEFGLIPQTQLKDMTVYFPKCDCCPLETIKADDGDGYVVKSIVSKSLDFLDSNVIFVQVQISDISFILHNKFYCINGRFYKKYDAIINKINMQLYPVIQSPRTLNEQLLMYGYIRNKAKLYKLVMPIDIIKVIILFYPAMYGAHYDIHKHNPDLNNQLIQKTNVFEIDNIKFYLKYGEQRDGDDDENYFDDAKNSYYLVLEFSKQEEIFNVVILCSIYCKVSKQSYTFIRSVVPEPVDNINCIELNNFGIMTSLSTLVCDVQIVNMLKANSILTVYEHPTMLTQNAYLLEWNIDEKLVDLFKEGKNNTHLVFESQIFYDLFKLRCYPNERNGLFLSIQLLSLPINRPNKKEIEGLKTICQIYETETNSHIPAFEAIFDYSENNSAFATYIMKSDKINNVKKLRFRVEIVIVNENNEQYYSNQNNHSFVANLHDGNAQRGIRQDRGRRT